MATTTNYGWETPDDTDLVKDGAAAIRTLGSSVDTTTKNLNPETTLGDISYRSSTANTNTRLAIGSTGQVLTVAGGVPTWAAAAAGGGKVLQVVYASTTTPVTLTSTSVYGDTGLEGTITPTLASSKVLIMTSQTAIISTAALLARGTRILRDASVIFTGGARNDFLADISGSPTPMYFGNRFSLMYLDTPSTTSSVTYKTQGIMEYGNSQTYQYNNGASTIILMEIGA
jgi:hypothetical protein